MRLRDIRRAKGLSVHEVARMANLGSSVLVDIESGILDPPQAVIDDLARALDCTQEEISESIPNPRRG